MKRSYILVVLFFLLSTAFSETLDWISYPSDPYLLGRGGAFLLDRRGENILYNPSVGPFLRDRNVNFSMGMLAFSRNIFNLSFYYPFPNRSGLFAGIIFNHTGGIEHTDIDANKLGEFSMNRFAFISGFAFRFGRSPVATSLTFKYFNETLYSLSGNGFGFKMNVSVMLRRFQFGVYIDNVNQTLFWEDDVEDVYEPVYGAVLSINITNELRLSTVFSFNLPFSYNYRIGLSYAATDNLSLGIGMMNYAPGVSVSYRINQLITLNYSFQLERSITGMNNIFGIKTVF